MRKARVALLVVSLMSLVSGTVLASDVSNATNEGTITVTNSGTAATGVVVPFSLATDEWIDNGYFDADCHNVAIQNGAGVDVPFMPGDSSWVMFAGALGSTSSTDFYLYTGGDTDMNGKIRCLPDESGVVISDSSSLELGTTFDIEVSGYIRPSISGVILYKPGSLVVYTDGGGTILAGTMDSGSQTVYLSPNGLGSETNIPYEYPEDEPHWSLVDDPPDSPDNETYVKEQGSSEGWDWYTVDSSTIPPFATEIDVLKVGCRVKKDYSSIGTAYAGVRLGDDYTYESWEDLSTSWTTYSALLERPGGGDWQVSDLESVQCGLKLENDYSDKYTLGTCVYLEVRLSAYVLTSTVESGAVSDGEHTVRLAANGGSLSLYVDDELQDTDTFTSWSDTGDDWQLGDGNALLYADSLEIEKSGSAVCSLDFTAPPNDGEEGLYYEDASSNGNDGFVTVPSAANDPDVTADITEYAPTTPASATSSSTDEAGNMLNGAPDMPTGMYDELEVDHLPGAALLNTLLDAGDIPRGLVWFPLAFFITVLLGLLVYYLARSILAMSITMVVALIVVIPFILIAAGVMIKEKTTSL